MGPFETKEFIYGKMRVALSYRQLPSRMTARVIPKCLLIAELRSRDLSPSTGYHGKRLKSPFPAARDHGQAAEPAVGWSR
jgi:hypothetical protein